MYVRLAFAVAAHLEPEILVVDEVLAVGDGAFQQKCIGHMRDVGRSGRTVFLVSHNMAAIENLCTRGLVLDHGELLFDGDIPDAVKAYQAAIQKRAALRNGQLGHRQCQGKGIFRSVTLLDDDNLPTNILSLGATFKIRIGLEVRGRIDLPCIGIGIDNRYGERMLTVHTPTCPSPLGALQEQCDIVATVANFPLGPGDYFIKLVLSSKRRDIDLIEEAFFFTVADGDPFGEGRGYHRGVCVARATWQVAPA